MGNLSRLGRSNNYTVVLITSVATTVGLISMLDNPVTMAYATELSRWVYAFLSFNLAQNILVNVLVIARIWRVNARSASFLVGTNLWPVIIAMMESGALYSSSVPIFLLVNTVVFTHLRSSDQLFFGVRLMHAIIMQLWFSPIFPGSSRPNVDPQQILTDMVLPINIIIGSCSVYAQLSDLCYSCLVRVGLVSRQTATELAKTVRAVPSFSLTRAIAEPIPSTISRWLHHRLRTTKEAAP